MISFEGATTVQMMLPKILGNIIMNTLAPKPLDQTFQNSELKISIRLSGTPKSFMRISFDLRELYQFYLLQNFLFIHKYIAYSI